MKALIIALAIFASECILGQTTVTVTVTDIQNEQGKVYFGLYSQDTFIKAKPNYSAIGHVKNHQTKVVFENISEGQYAITCFQDTNGNHKFDFQPNGAPAEPYGVSRNAKSYYGPPLWSDAKFIVKQEPVAINMKL